MEYDAKDLANTLKIIKKVKFQEIGEEIVIDINGKSNILSKKQIFGLIKKLGFYLELDERCIDRDGPQFKAETSSYVPPKPHPVDESVFK